MRRSSTVAFAVLVLGSLGACANSCSKDEQPSKPIEARPGTDRLLNDKYRFQLYPPDAPAE